MKKLLLFFRVTHVQVNALQRSSELFKIKLHKIEFI